MATPQWKKHVQKTWVQWVLGGVIALGMVVAVQAYRLRDKTPDSKIKQALLAVGYPEVFTLEEYRRATKVMRPASKRNFDFELPFRGVRLLSQGDLLAQSQLMLTMAGLANEGHCADMWRGTLGEEGIFEVYEAMDEGTLRKWARIMKKSARLALLTTEWPKIDEEAYYDSLSQVMNLLGAEDRARFEEVLDRADVEGSGPTDADACWAFKTLHGNLPKVEPLIADTVLRAIGGATRFTNRD